MRSGNRNWSAPAGGASWRRFGLPIGLLLVAGVVGCSPTAAYLEPAPLAKTLPRRRHDVVSEVAGIRMVADGDAWDADPGNLGNVITPVKVYLRNESGTPLRVRYKDFRLTAAGFTSMALPPYKISGTVNEPRFVDVPVVPAFAYSRFFIAPYYAPYYDWDFDMWNGPFAWDPAYYQTYYTMWQESLPTQDMRAEGIPEGVLNPDGRLSGFLYFQKIDKHAGPVTLTFDLVNADTGKHLGTIKLPFVTK
jgi:hypothetical protein